MSNEETQADTIVILSSDLIAKIAQDYFNKVMFKQKVEIVDLKPHGESGYAFSVAFVHTTHITEKAAATEATYTVTKAGEAQLAESLISLDYPYTNRADEKLIDHVFKRTQDVTL